MKKIMKKAMGLALTLVMVLSLAPVTAMASVVGPMGPINSPVGDNSGNIGSVSGGNYGSVSGGNYGSASSDAYVIPMDKIAEAEEGEDVIYTSEELADVIKAAAEADEAVIVPTTAENVVMSFAGKDLLEAGDFKLNLTVAVKDDVEDKTVAKSAKITKDNFVLKIEFNHDGNLPGEATIRIGLPEDIAEKYEKLYYYQIMEDGKLKFICDAPVEDGVATVKQDHCSDYVLLTEKVADDTEKEAAKAPKTGDSSNIALWVAVLGLGVVAIAGSAVMKKREF